LTDTLIIIPAFNEEAGIAAVVADIHTQAPDFDVLVVDDGSSDGTARAARDAGAIVLAHNFNMGYGVTIQTGYKFAYEKGYKYIIQIDGDGQHDPSFMSQLLEPVRKGDVDFTLGSRDGSGYCSSVNW